ncbi:MAG TPA: acyl-CoA dehydrogenase family protein [Polyangiaceae bacterium]|nr:acyl-CoA dehydrogenase family protein [Polyangiaceae bacterium]
MTHAQQGSPLEALVALDAELDEDERLVRASVRRFVRERYLPRAAELYAKEEFSRDLVPELGELGALGASLRGYGCAGMGAVAYGLMLEELEYGDSGLRSFVSVQGSLAMFAIHAFGSEQQKLRFLPEMARGRLIGCFGLTEPDSGSDPGAMLTRARRDGSDFVLDGTKMWITNAPFADLAVVWAKVDGGGPESIRGFVVERGLPGFSTSRIHGKMSLRSSETGALHLEGCRVPADAALEHKPGLGAALRCLNEARLGISWGAVGAAKACFDCALDYTKQRRQFGVPLAKKQLVQAELSEMASGVAGAELLSYHFARRKERGGGLTPAQVSLCKRSNVAMALDVARAARNLLGANGILLEYPVIRHLLNLESVYTYEGTHQIHTLVLGKALTGEDAF